MNNPQQPSRTDPLVDLVDRASRADIAAASGSGASNHLVHDADGIPINLDERGTGMMSQQF